MNDSLDVSVVIAIYNHADLVGEALASVFAQELAPAEVILVDDGSTDAIGEAIRPWRNRVHFLRQKRGGTAAAWNRGVRNSSGALIAFLDADDYWPPDFLARQVKIISSDSQAGMVFGDFLFVGSNTDLESPSCFAREGWDEGFFGDTRQVVDAFEKLLAGNFIATGTVVLRKSAFDFVGGFASEIGLLQNWHLWIRMSRYSKVLWTPAVCLFRRIHSANSSGSLLACQESVAHIADHLVTSMPELFDQCPIRPREWQADAHWRLARLHFGMNNQRQARESFRRSVRLAPRVKTVLWWLATFLNPRVIAWVRGLKGKFFSPTLKSGPFSSGRS